MQQSKFHSNRLNQWGSFFLMRNNRRKTTSARHTQVIDVPKYIPKKGLNKTEKLAVEAAIRCKTEHLNLGLFIKNENPFAGKRKFIFHARPNA